MANNQAFKIKNGLLAKRYLQKTGTNTEGTAYYRLDSASYDNKSFDFSSQFTNDGGLAFNNDGTKMYIVAFTTPDAVYQYSLSTAYDVSTASYDSVSFDVSGQAGTAVAVKFNPSGTKMYIGDYGTDTTYQYSLSTAFDISTASYDSVSFSTASQDTLLRDIAFNSDGTAFYMIGTSTDTVYQYSLSTAYDISTASYDSVNFDVSNQIANPYSLVFNSDGTKMLVSGSSLIQEYTLSTGFDLSTASASSVSYTDANVGSTVRGLVFNDDGTKLYWLDTNTVFQYSVTKISQTLDLATGHYFDFELSGDTVIELSNQPASGKAYVTQVEVTGNSSIVVNDISDATYDSKSFSVSGQLANDSLAFKTDGTKMYCLNQGTRVGHQYSLSTPWDISTASYDSVTGSFTGQTSSPSGLKLSSDGTKCFVLDSGVITDRIYQYTLSTAWDLSSVSYDSVSLSVNGLDTTGVGFCFNSDGTELYYMGQATETIYQYSLSTAWDLSTADYYSSSRSFSFAAQTAECRNVIINLDGTKMYIVEEGNSDFVHQYTLSTAFDVSTASYDSDNFSLSSQEASPRDIEFNDDFTKMYALGQINSTVFQYTTGSNNPHVLTWPDSIKWDLGAAAPSPDAGSKDMYSLITIDGGTTYYGKGTGENIS